MNTPTSYREGLRPDARPEYTADRVVPRVNPDAKPVQQFGEALGDVGLGVLRINEVLAERLDRAKATEADAKIADGYREILTGPNGYQSQLGRNATDKREDTVKALDERRQTILDTLTPSQRQLLAESDAARYRHAREHVDSHYTRQLAAYEQGQIEARAEGLMQDAVTAAVTPPLSIPGVERSDEFGEKRAALRTSLTELAARRGYSPEERDALLQKSDDNMHGAVVRWFVNNGNARGGREFLDKHESRLSADAKAKLVDGLDVAVAKEDGLWFASQLAQEAQVNGNPNPSTLDLIDSLQTKYQKGELGKNADLVFDTAVKALTHHDRQVSEERTRLQNSAWAAIERNAEATGGRLDAEHQQLLKTAKLEARYAEFLRRGQQYTTSEVGSYAVSSLRAEDLARMFGSEDAVRANYQFETTPAQLGDLVRRYREGVAAQQGKLPQDDPSIVLADGLRRATGLKTTDKVDPDLLKRWTNSVRAEQRALMSAKPGLTEDAALRPAIDLAAQKGFYLDEKAAGPIRLYLQADPKEAGGPVYVRQQTATGMRVVEARLTDIYPASGLTYRDTVEQQFKAQAMLDQPGKPRGSVRRADGSVVQYSALTPNDVVQGAVLLHERVNESQMIAKRSLGREFLTNLYAKKVNDVARDTPQGTPIFAPDGRGYSDHVRDAARDAVLREAASWSGYGLTPAEVDAIIGAESAARKRERESMVDLLRVQDPR